MPLYGCPNLVAQASHVFLMPSHVFSCLSHAFSNLVAQASHGFSCLLMMRIDPHQEVMVEVWEGRLPEITPPLAVWPISGNTMQRKEFQEKLQNFSYHRGGKNLHNHTTLSAKSGSAGALNGISIPFQDL